MLHDMIDYDILKSSVVLSTAWVLVCMIVYQLGSWISAKIPRFVDLPEKIRVDWLNRFVSIFHATIMSSFSLYYWFFINPSQVITEKVTIWQGIMLDVMCGYLWYDFVSEMLKGGSIEIVGHHLIGLVSHYSSRLSDNGAAGFYSMIVFVAETSTPFLHTSWFLHQLNHRDTMIFKALVVLLLVLFFLCRYLLGPYMVWHMLMHRAHWGGVDSFEMDVLYWMNVIIVALFALLNIYWFHKLVAVAMPKKEKKRKE